MMSLLSTNVPKYHHQNICKSNQLTSSQGHLVSFSLSGWRYYLSGPGGQRLGTNTLNKSRLTSAASFVFKHSGPASAKLGKIANL